METIDLILFAFWSWVSGGFVWLAEKTGLMSLAHYAAAKTRMRIRSANLLSKIHLAVYYSGVTRRIEVGSFLVDLDPEEIQERVRKDQKADILYFVNLYDLVQKTVLALSDKVRYI
jgi:hypothetical protein